MAGCIAGNGGGWFLCLEACVAFSILKALIPGGQALVYWFLDLFLCGHRFYARAVGRVGSMHTMQPGVGGLGRFGWPYWSTSCYVVYHCLWIYF